MKNSTIEEARQLLMLQGRKIEKRFRKRRKQMRLERRRIGRIEKQLDELIELTYFGLVPGAQIKMPHSPQPYLQIVAVQPDSVSVCLPDGREHRMGAVCLISLVTSEGACVIPPAEETSDGLSG